MTPPLSSWSPDRTKVSPENPKLGSWRHHLVYREERLRTTWKLRAAGALVFATAVWLAQPWWTSALGNSLICSGETAPSDAILIENFDIDYLLFERARELRRRGLAPRVLVPVPVDANGSLNRVPAALTRMMGELARLESFEVVPVREVEPISMNAARDILDYLKVKGIRSVMVVTPLFRSKRSELVYDSVFGPAGIAVRCQPVEGTRDARSWTESWHGIQNVVEQWGKLQYYKFYVMPFASVAQ